MVELRTALEGKGADGLETRRELDGLEGRALREGDRTDDGQRIGEGDLLQIGTALERPVTDVVDTGREHQFLDVGPVRVSIRLDAAGAVRHI